MNLDIGYSKSPSLLTRLSPWIVLTIILTYMGAFFISAPYLGFDFKGDQVTKIFIRDMEISVGDQILMIDGKSWQDLQNSLSSPLFPAHEHGDLVKLRILKEDGEQKDITLSYQSIIDNQFYARLISPWWFSLIFWGAGTLILLVIRPRDARWRLLVAYMFLFSVFLASSSGPSDYHFYGSQYVIRIAGWFLLPVTIHLHWEFPHPLTQPSLQLVKKGMLYFAYLVGIIMAVLQFIIMDLQNLFRYGVAVGLFISIILLFVHYFSQKEYRLNAQILFYFSLIALSPFLIIFILEQIGYNFPTFRTDLAILGLPLLPLGYTYTIFRRQLGKFELRTNRAVSVYFFSILLLTFVFIASRPLLDRGFNDRLLSYLLLLSLSLGVFSAIAFQPFQRFVEKTILAMPLPPEGISSKYANIVSTLTETDELVEILTSNILASMLIRQSAILNNYNDQETNIWLYADHVNPPNPSIDDYAKFLTLSGKFFSPVEENQLPEGFEWVRLILPLQANNQTLGLWFLGQKDPDDYYSQPEIMTLQSLANQTATMLINHQQANSLRALYQVNVYRHEMERANLGRELHDETLNQLASIKQMAMDNDLRDEIEETINKLRNIIAGLRPNMLNFGLMTALQDLADEYNQRFEKININFEVTGDMAELGDSLAEQQTFRIIQQAIDNAMSHEECKNILISGSITKDRIYIEVEDDGPGFELDPDFNIADLLEQKRFGLAGMYERASVIYAQLNIKTSPGSGTIISLDWAANDLPYLDLN